MNVGKPVGDFLEPIQECAEFDTLGHVVDTMSRGKPVAVRWATWWLLLPEDVIGYPLSRRVIDLPLRDVPLIPPELAAEEALTRLIEKSIPYALVVAGKVLLGMVSLQGLHKHVEVAERRRVEQAFQASLRQKEVLLREVYHRVKNNLQIVSSLLNLQASSVQDPLVREMFMATQNRVMSMALIHDTLSQSSDVGTIELGAYVRTLALQLWRSYDVEADRIALNIQTDAVMLGINQAIPSGLIVNELLSNCLKHAFPAGSAGEIHIELRSNAVRQVTIIVRDTGVGFPAGKDFRDAETLGLQLVCTLAEQLGGLLELESSGGTAFTLTFTV
ncbi:MAG TPA: histidine kinase dimerization/phosphoacceptor domain -containing protein [Candidatus Tectomicrobia bacterium]|nr:histidine kinase dimerization/phosphoacceptor domain -containing protein [Candidatus Tectomicrobia bacterium]